MVLQSMAFDASPTKWHLAHTTWFFETFVLAAFKPGYRAFDPSYAYLFNSYYEAAGPRHPRPQRGLISRPTVESIMSYRQHVDDHMLDFLQTTPSDEARSVIELGLAHEQQHQELLLMDILHLFAQSPIRPAYDRSARFKMKAIRQSTFKKLEGGLVTTGVQEAGFAYDNEGPAHRVWLEPFEIADRLVTAGEWLGLHECGRVRAAAVVALRRLEPGAGASLARTTVLGMGWPGMAAHDASRYATGRRGIASDAPQLLRGRRLRDLGRQASADRGGVGARRFQPTGSFDQLYEAAWQWTAAALPTPATQPAKGALGEYNGKFMMGQMTLRGASLDHALRPLRATYRNFFSPTSAGCSPACASPKTPAAQRRRSDQDCEFSTRCLAGPVRSAKSISPKWFYDAHGSDLFEDITEMPEYYPTRTETGAAGRYRARARRLRFRRARC